MFLLMGGFLNADFITEQNLLDRFDIRKPVKKSPARNFTEFGFVEIDCGNLNRIPFENMTVVETSDHNVIGNA